MYIPKSFTVENEQEIFSFIESNGFGQLTSMVDGKLFASHLPFLLSENKRKVFMHIAKQNPQHENIAGQECLIVLQGPHDYISPTWYEEVGVPTWNYQAAHIYGECQVFEDNERLKLLVDETSAYYESVFEKPWQPNYNANLLNAIIGIEMTITDIQCKYKLSQNRSKADRTNVIDQLNTRGSTKLAEQMAKINNL